MSETFDDRESGARRWIFLSVTAAAVVAVVVGAIVVANRDSGGGPPDHEAPAGALTPAQASDFAGCLRRHGMDVPEPRAGDDGEVAMEPPAGVDANGPEFQQALRTCREELATRGGMPPEGHGG